MDEITISTTLQVYDNINELPKDIQSLMDSAIEARNNAYAPYSNFNVGAALLLDNDEVVIGSNQENASYPSGLCAERTAIYYAGAKYSKAKILKMAISASSQNQVTDKPIPPCGACRQSIAEYEIKQDQPIEIYFMGAKGKVVKSKSLSNLLPLLFDNSVL
ncbi:cytidine deaminase [Winogradskyella echinorum]|uniref:Cytidine deaminase n=1 Tax=Winogradskyella echinorum TaxID=538189 RepID=A0ABR6Y493_9FLAO|nr:cytidine deaminase [Winogradskyella echinorum]MBC3847569.1 cytidine deaminase [Winogradskyella echinorum]MBC5751917.1 cytidine deaminase [Winogradskyella echinorum]